MAELFVRLLLGHLVGDYLLQSKEMALRKTENTSSGYWVCFWHCLVYYYSISLFLMDKIITLGNSYGSIFIFSLLLFATHWFIDRYSLADKWLKLIKGRTIEGICKQGEVMDLSFYANVGFTSVAYTIVDNTMHLLLMLAVVRLFL